MGGASSTRSTGTLGEFLRLSRVSNLPSVWSNALTGVALGLHPATPTLDGAPAFPWATAAVVAGSASLLYVAGMALNDAVDAPIDAAERPERPIPSGRVSRRTALAYAAVMMLLGLSAASALGTAALQVAGVLVLCIVAYDLLSKRWVGAPVLMSACRGLVYALGAAAGSPDWRIALLFVAPVAVHTFIITLIARGESSGEPGAASVLAWVSPVLLLLPLLSIRPREQALMASVGGALLLLHLFATLPRAHDPRQVRRCVVAWIVGFCLIDAFYLSILDLPLPATLGAAFFLLGLWAQRRILGT